MLPKVSKNNGAHFAAETFLRLAAEHDHGCRLEIMKTMAQDDWLMRAFKAGSEMFYELIAGINDEQFEYLGDDLMQHPKAVMAMYGFQVGVMWLYAVLEEASREEWDGRVN